MRDWPRANLGVAANMFKLTAFRAETKPDDKIQINDSGFGGFLLIKCSHI
jgi:hypothetical protein